VRGGTEPLVQDGVRHGGGRDRADGEATKLGGRSEDACVVAPIQSHRTARDAAVVGSARGGVGATRGEYGTGCCSCIEGIGEGSWRTDPMSSDIEAVMREDRLKGGNDKDDKFVLERQQAGAAAIGAAVGSRRRRRWQVGNREKSERARPSLRRTAVSCGKGRQRRAA
jgi:hypothetical protein